MILPYDANLGRIEYNPDGNSKRTLTVIAIYSPRARSDLGVADHSAGGIIVPHVLRPENCKGKQPLGDRALRLACRLRGQHEVIAFDGDLIWVHARICQFVHDIPQDINIWSCGAIADYFDSRYGGTGGLQVSSYPVPFYAPAKILSVDPPIVYSWQYPTRPGPRQSAVVLSPESRAREDLVKLRVTGTISQHPTYPRPVSNEPVVEVKPAVTAVGALPLFRVRYRYDSDGAGHPSAPNEGWIDAGPIAWDGASSELIVEIPRAFASGSPCSEMPIFRIRTCADIEIELSSFDAGALYAFRRSIFPFELDNQPTDGPIADLLDTWVRDWEKYQLVSINRNHINYGDGLPVPSQLQPDAVSRVKITVVPKQVVDGLLHSSLSAPKLDGPCDGGQSAVRDSQIRFAVDAEPSDRPFINGFEVAMYYFQPSTIPPFGTWVRYPKLWDLDLQDGDLSTQSFQSAAYMRSYGLQWRWRAAETNESRVGPFSEWCHFKLHDPLGIGVAPIASGAIGFDRQTSAPFRHIH